MERTYFYSALEHKGRYLLDEQLGVVGQTKSPLLQKQLLKLAAALPYQVAQQLFFELTGLAIGTSSLWQLTQDYGQNLEQKTEDLVAQHFTAPDPCQPKPAPTSKVGPVRRGVGMDGVMIHIRGEGYKETKLGCLFEVVAANDKVGQPYGQAEKQSYYFYLGGPQTFGQRLYLASLGRAFEAAGAKCILGDGASWIWNLANEHWGEGLEIVDYYHAKQHLWNAANLLYGEGSLKSRQLVEVYGDLLYEGCADMVAAGLEANLKAVAVQTKVAASQSELIQREANYFRTNQARMNYKAYRQALWPIGSGVVEAGCKLFKARFGGSGMRWSRGGASHLMPFRAALMGDDFDQLWRKLCPQN